MSESPSRPPSVRGRRAVAFVMSVLVPGSGHVFLGRWRRGFLLVGVGIAILFAIPATRFIGTVAGLVFGLAIHFDLLFVRVDPIPRGSRLAILWAGLLVFLLVFRFSFRAYYLEVFEIPTPTMAPTLVPGDRIVVAKVRRTPVRGDIIVFRLPQNPDKNFVKRVIGVAGDRIATRGGTLFLNDAPVSGTETHDCDSYDDSFGTWTKEPSQCVEETLGPTRYRVIVQSRSVDRLPDFPGEGAAPYVVPPDSVFVMGDNREHSNDSRSWGHVPLDHVEGTVLFVWWTWNDVDGLRWDRLGSTPR